MSTHTLTDKEKAHTHTHSTDTHTHIYQHFSFALRHYDSLLFFHHRDFRGHNCTEVTGFFISCFKQSLLTKDFSTQIHSQYPRSGMSGVDNVQNNLFCCFILLISFR